MKRFELCRTKQERIQWLAENNVVEKIVIKTIKQQMDIEDLVAEIYLILLEKEDECIEKMDDKRLRNYVISIVRNQFNSSTSPYYKNYKRHDRFKSDIDFDINDETGEIVPLYNEEDYD